MTGRLQLDYFERIYAEGDDPWGFESAWYERRKQALTMALLPNEHYRRVFEPGCASGELSLLLAARADEVVALELMPRIAERARQRLAASPNVSVEVGGIPEDWPDGSFDLILLSEVAYYLDSGAFEDMVGHVTASLQPGGHVVAVHYLGETDYPLTGAQVHDHLQEKLPGFSTIATYSEPAFAALVLQRGD